MYGSPVISTAAGSFGAKQAAQNCQAWDNFVNACNQGCPYSGMFGIALILRTPSKCMMLSKAEAWALRRKQGLAGQISNS